MHWRTNKKSEWGLVSTGQEIEPIQEKYRVEDKEDQIIYKIILDETIRDINGTKKSVQ